jgi:hypothetical protein
MKQHRFDKDFQAIMEAVNNVYNPLEEDKGLMDYLTFKFNQWNRLQKNPIKDKAKAKAEFKKMLDAKDQKIKDWMKEYKASKGKMNEARKLSKDAIKDIEALYKKTPVDKAVNSPYMQKMLDKRFGDSVYVVHLHFSPEWDKDDMGGATKFKGLNVK